MKITQELVKLYMQDLLVEYTIRQISKKLGKSYSYTYEVVQKYLSSKVLKARKKGASTLCSLNLDNDRTKILLFECSIEKKERFKELRPGLAQACEELTEKLKERLKGSLLSLILFGSYAKGEETKESDLDFLVIVPDKKEADEIVHRESSSLEMRYGKRVSPIVITPEMLVNMIKAKGENVGKEALRGNVIFTGFEKFWETVIEGAK